MTGTPVSLPSSRRVLARSLGSGALGAPGPLPACGRCVAGTRSCLLVARVPPSHLAVGLPVTLQTAAW